MLLHPILIRLDGIINTTWETKYTWIIDSFISSALKFGRLTIGQGNISHYNTANVFRSFHCVSCVWYSWITSISDNVLFMSFAARRTPVPVGTALAVPLLARLVAAPIRSPC